MSLESASQLPTTDFTSPRGLRYRYIHLQATPAHANPKKAYILILHGFPSIPTDFHAQIAYFHHLGYSIIAPYLLGYHPTSTPTDPSLYRLKAICQDLIALLDHLDVSQPCLTIGHDWGATLLSRLEYYYPSRLQKLAYLSIAPVPFGQEFDLDKVNEMTRQMTGQAMFGYQKFFMDGIETDRAASLMQDKHERMEMLMFAQNSESLWKQYFCALGGLEKWLLVDEQAVTFHVAKEVLNQRNVTFKAGEQGIRSDSSMPGYAGSLNWYTSHNGNLNVSDEQSKSGCWENYQTDKKVLLVLSKHDPSASSDMHLGMAKAYVKDASKQLTVVSCDAGHFPMLQQAHKLNLRLQEFLVA